jgi:(2R)-sulfolactate sulfo-lyase subunit alpha
MDHRFLIHEPGDSVGVAVAEIKAGEEITGTFLHDHSPSVVLTARQDIPLGHKIALAAVAAKGHVLKYGLVIGAATKAITPGDHVHVHNLRSGRWVK